MTRKKPKSKHTLTSGKMDASTTRSIAPTELLRRLLLGAICALFVARPLFTSESAAVDGDGLPVVMLWLILCVVWLLGACSQSKFRLRAGPVDLFVLLLIVLHSIAALVATYHGSPRPAVNMLWQWVGLGSAFFLARQCIKTGREIRAVVVVMIALAVAISGYGLYQYTCELPQTCADYAKNPDQTLRDAKIWYPPNSAQRRLFESRLNSTEPLGTFALANSLAGFLAPWLVILLGVGFSLKPTDQSKGWIWSAVVICGVPIAVCLALTRSRTACLAAVFGVALVWMLSRLHKKQTTSLALIVIVVVVMVAVVVGLTHLDLVSAAVKSLEYRVEYWRSTFHMIAENPWFGCGPGNFQDTYTRYKLPQASEEVADPHNFILEIWSTSGTPAMLAMLAVLGYFAWSVYRGCGREFNETSPNNDNGSYPTNFVYAGAAVGFLLAWPLSLVSAVPSSTVVFVLGMPLAVASIVLLDAWVKFGRMLTWLPTIGIVVLLVNLLGAGGIGFPGVAGTLWLLLAIRLNMDEVENCQGCEPGLVVPRYAAFAGFVTVVVLAIACYNSGYRPVLRCQTLLRQASRQPSQSELVLRAATVADPLSAKPWDRLAWLEFSKWQQTKGSYHIKRFEVFNRNALKLAPSSSALQLVTGDRYLTFYSETHRPEFAECSVEAYTKAVELYPNNGLWHAKLAVAFRAIGKQAEFEREADFALRLDELTPHADKKLPEELRQNLMRRP